MTCIYLATKTEEVSIKVEDLASVCDVQATAIVSWEVNVLKCIQFHLRLYHPFTSIITLCSTLEELQSSSAAAMRGLGADVINMSALQEQAISLASSLYLTDAVFLYPPAQVALSCLRKAAQLKYPAVNFQAGMLAACSEVLRLAAILPLSKIGSNRSSNNNSSNNSSGRSSIRGEAEVNAVLERLAGMDAFFQQAAMENEGRDPELVTRLKIQLSQTLNPSMDPDHPFYQRLEEEKKLAKEAKKDEKHR